MVEVKLTAEIPIVEHLRGVALIPSATQKAPQGYLDESGYRRSISKERLGSGERIIFCVFRKKKCDGSSLGSPYAEICQCGQLAAKVCQTSSVA